MSLTAWFEGAAQPVPVMQPRRSGSALWDGGRTRNHRTIFISDVHLGTRHCKADVLADFLARNDCQTLYLVGDIMDGWQFRNWYWSPAQDRVVEEVLRKLDDGTRVVFVPGNHDDFARDFSGRRMFGTSFGGIEIIPETIHTTADGKRLWVLHGDRFDGVIRNAAWLAHLGDWAYGVALRANDGLLAIRKILNLPHWSLSAWAKHKVKNAAQFISSFEAVVAREAQARGVDGVVCGHIHHAEIRKIGEVLYLNDGDWVESCTALVEDARGNMEILRWSSSLQANRQDPTPPAAAQAPPLAAAKGALIPA